MIFHNKLISKSKFMKETFNYYEFLEAGENFTKFIANYFEKLHSQNVLPKRSFGELIDLFKDDFPKKPENLKNLLKDFEKKILPFVVHWNHPNFYSYFNSTTNAPGILSEYLTSALNANSMHWDSNPAGVELEIVVLNWLQKALGIKEDFFALTYDTASLSSFHAMAAARELKSDWTFRKKGVASRNYSNGIVCYCSELAHSSIEKNALVLGFGEEGVKKISVDENFSINTNLLENEIKKDISLGKVPVCAVATVGGTALGSVDDVKKIYEICAKYNIWLHVDAAWAGACALLPQYSKIFEAWNFADSIVVNPHKWMFVPFDCSVLFIKNKKALASAFSLTPSYLESSDYNSINFMDYSLPLGRKFRALKMYFVFKYFGFEGIARFIEDNIALAKYFANKIKEDEDFELLEPQNFGLVCFKLNEKTFKDQDLNKKLYAKVNGSGNYFISSAIFKGQTFLRASFSSPYQNKKGADQLFEILKRYAKELKNEK